MARDTITAPPAEQLAQLPEDLVKVAREVADLRDRQDTSAARLTELEDGLDGAQEKDRQAAADALRAGKPDPGRKATAKVENGIDKEKATIEALEVAVGDAEAELEVATSAYMEAHGDQLNEQIQRQRGECLAATDQLKAQTDEWRTSLALRAWLRDPRRRFDPAPFGQLDTEIRMPNGSQASVQQLTTALLGAFAPPEKPAERPAKPPLWPRP